MTELIYISGKITGEPNYKTKFMYAEEDLRFAGFRTINPAQAPTGLPPSTYVHMALAQIDAADAVALLTNWEDSAGAKIEKAYAEYIGKPVFRLEELTERRLHDNQESSRAV